MVGWRVGGEGTPTIKVWGLVAEQVQTSQLDLRLKGVGVCRLPTPGLQDHKEGRQGHRQAVASQPAASTEPAGSLHAEPVTCQIIARLRKENRNIQCQQFTKYDS